MKVHLTTLGCPKNQVDSELMLGHLAADGHPPVERYAGAAAVVTGQQTVGSDHDVLLTERARVDSALAGRLAAVPGVKAAIGDVSVPVRLGQREAAGRLTVPVAEMSTIFVHMFVNRIIRSAARAHELVLYDFLYQLHESREARKRKGPPSTPPQPS